MDYQAVVPRACTKNTARPPGFAASSSLTSLLTGRGVRLRPRRCDARGIFLHIVPLDQQLAPAWYMHVYARLLGQQLAPIDEGLRLANEHLALGSRRVAPRGELGGEDGVEARGE
eukprot:scaffold67023_cov62-Phaeocystis_antarctica.AAC.1